MLYQLFAESGPQHKKTMIHILPLSGCTVNGPTTAATIASAPDTIRTYLTFLQRHGETVTPDQWEIQTEVIAHVTDGAFLGKSDPTNFYPPYQLPFTPDELETCIRRLEWQRADIIAIVQNMSDTEFFSQFPTGGRAPYAMLNHIYNVEYAVIRYLGKLEGIKGPDSNRERSKTELVSWMQTLRTAEMLKLRSLTPDELAHKLYCVANPRSVRTLLRGVMEHEWEHLVELQARM
jgi:uncharacterized damage-inducible protein DinB